MQKKVVKDIENKWFCPKNLQSKVINYRICLRAGTYFKSYTKIFYRIIIRMPYNSKVRFGSRPKPKTQFFLRSNVCLTKS